MSRIGKGGGGFADWSMEGMVKGCSYKFWILVREEGKWEKENT
jgi:hypothetical protein